jgi:Domain of unknown function (DUF4287)
MTHSQKVKGPASYFPSIEKKYGQPIRHWISLLEALGDRKHMEMVAWLKTEHQMGHGHANALVAYHLARAKRAQKFR